MAKEKEKQAAEVPSPAPLAGPASQSAAATPAPSPAAPPAHVAKRNRKWKVELKALTPIQHNPLIVDAVDENDALRQFCKANGLQGSRCPWIVEPV